MTEGKDDRSKGRQKERMTEGKSRNCDGGITKERNQYETARNIGKGMRMKMNEQVRLRTMKENEITEVNQ